MTKKLIFVILLIISICFVTNLFYYNTYGAGKKSADDIMKGADSFLQSGTEKAVDTASLQETSEFFFNLLLAFGMVAAVIVGMIIGIKFMTSSIEEKAKIKELLVPYVVSCVVIFGAFGIWKIAVNIFTNW